jgi:tripartite-type tricarboxylate transporter receptor subunit TctC
VLPDVPTVSERAIPGFEAAGWQGYFVPAGTPRQIVERIQREAVATVALPDTQTRLKTMGNDPVASTPVEFDAKFRADVAKFQQVVREAGIPLQ